ncbi:MAG TPA: cation:proton antiporter [Xanthomonadales bacterium]|nr:cation:proton antiporter [Xanthomonadales bacterium]
MGISYAQTANLLFALAALMIAAHLGGQVFARFRQPRVIGEIFGGFLLGPSCLGMLFPGIEAALFPSTDGVTLPVLGAVYQLGLMLLMFCSGLEIRASFDRRERRTAGYAAAFGTVLPFVLGVAAILASRQSGSAFLDAGRFIGSAGSETAFLLVFAIAISVTSIPVISRILTDLDLLDTSLARVVLAAAVVEDILLYVLLAVAVGLVGAVASDGGHGLSALLGLAPGTGSSLLYHSLAPVLFIAASLAFGPRLLARLRRPPLQLPVRAGPTAFLMTFLLLVTAFCLFLGVTPIFGAFVAGLVVGTRLDELSPAREAIKQFSFAFFVPIYFALVGFRLDLLAEFDAGYFLLFFGFACAVKTASVWLGARAAGEPNDKATDIAVAMNARGGPGIVLASVALESGIIAAGFFNQLVLLSVLTSLLAGIYLERIARARYRPVTPAVCEP